MDELDVSAIIKPQTILVTVSSDLTFGTQRRGALRVP
jgi:hypothetical protein